MSTPGLAVAQDGACGPVVNGAVTCPVDPDLYPGGVSYVVGAPAGDLTLNLAAGAEIASQGPALTVVNPFGDVTIQASEAYAVTSADDAIAVLASTGQGSVGIDIAGVATWGIASHGVVGFADRGDVTIRADEVYTFGDFSTGVSGVSNRGDVSLDVGMLSTLGDDSVGLSATAYDGDIRISAGFLSTAGGGSTGIEAVNSTVKGLTSVEITEMFTAGPSAVGVAVNVTNSLNVSAGRVITTGDQSHGLMTWSETGENRVQAGEVATFGHGSTGVIAESDAGDVFVDLARLETNGSGSYGLVASSWSGDLHLRLGEVRTTGSASTAVIAYSEFGSTQLEADKVITLRDDAAGIFVGGGHHAEVEVGQVLTSGFGSVGVQIVSGVDTEERLQLGQAVLRAGSIETRGAEAAGASVVSVGDADVAIGSVRTYGEDAHGVATFSRYGDSTVEVGRVHTSGIRASGLYAGTEDGDLRLKLGEGVTEDDLASVVQVVTRRGDADIAVLGDLTTSGRASRGILGSANYGDLSIASAGVIRTFGDESQGIYTAAIGRTRIAAADIRTSGARAIGIEAWSAADAAGTNAPHSIDIVAGSISTAGAEAHGVKATNAETGFIISDDGEPTAVGSEAWVLRDEAAERDITIRAGSISVTGEGAKGVLVEGAEDVSVGLIDAASRLEVALSIVARANATATLDGVVSGGTHAAEVKGENVNVVIGAAGVVRGATDALVLSAVGPYVPPEDDGGVGPFAVSPGRIAVDNRGVVIGGAGFAVRVTDGTATINNSGRIEGRLSLADGDDRVVNTGTLVVAGDSDFGAGDDLLTNSGVVRFAASAAPVSVAFRGLERFSNEGGLIDLRNGRAGDRFTLEGAYVGAGEARLGLDVRAGVADRLVVAGAATGTTMVELQPLKPEDATLLAAPVDLITAGAGSAADAFRLESADQGLVRYGLAYDAASRTFALTTSAGLPVHRLLRGGEGIMASWRASAEAFDADQALSRALGGPDRGVWAQLHGSSTQRDGDSEAFALDYDQDLVGGQMGASLASRAMAGGETVFGLTGGYAESELSFKGGGQETALRTFNLGAYGAWERDALFATALIKVDSHRIRIEDRQAGFDAEIDGLSWGGQLRAGYRFEAVGIIFEPSAGLDYVSTSLDDLEVLGQRVVFEDQAGFTARIGGRASRHLPLSSGRTFSVSGGLEALHAFDTESVALLESGGQIDRAATEGLETWGRAFAGVQVEVTPGLAASLEAEGRFGDGQSGGGLRMGIRYRF